MSCHQHLSSGLHRLEQLQEEATRPFFDIRTVKYHGERVERLKIRAGLVYQILKDTTSRLSPSQLPYAIEGLLACNGIENRTLVDQDVDKYCPICPIDCRTLEDTLEDDIASAWEMCRRRHEMHMNAPSHETDGAKVFKEFIKYSALSRVLVHAIERALSKSDVLSTSETSQIISEPILYHDDRTSLGYCYLITPDCLLRNNFHRWLDQMWLSDVVGDLELEDRFQYGFERDENNADVLGRTPLHIACQKGWGAYVRMMLEHDIDVDTATVYGHSPLHYAAARGSLEICRMLLEFEDQHDIGRKDCKGRTARVYAELGGHKDVIDLLDSVLKSSEPDIITELAEVTTHVVDKACRWDGCKLVLKGTKDLRKHLLSEHVSTQRPIRCMWERCNTTHERSFEYLNHFFSTHAYLFVSHVAVDQQYIGVDKDSLYICLYRNCGARFSWAEDALSHVQSHSS